MKGYLTSRARARHGEAGANGFTTEQRSSRSTNGDPSLVRRPWRWSAALPDAARRPLRAYILLSIAWGPLAGLAGFMVLATAASVGIGVLAMFR